MKILVTFDMAVVRQCQYFFGCLPIRHSYTLRRMGFLSNMSTTGNALLGLIYEMTGSADVAHLASFYDCGVSEFINKFSCIVLNQFKQEAN